MSILDQAADIKDRQILICGGSLAGLSAAIKLKNLGYTSCILEKSQFPREKLCGEFLGPDALQALNELGALENIAQIASERITDAYFYNLKGQSLHVPLSLINKAMPFAFAVPRSILDYTLQQYAKQLGIEISENTHVVSTIESEQGKFILTARRHEIDIQYRAPYIVDASGRYGGLRYRGVSYRHQQSSSTIGLQCHIHLLSSTCALQMFFFPGGYGGLQPLDSKTANLCIIFSSKAEPLNLQNLFSEMLRRLMQNPAAYQRLRGVTLAGAINRTGPLNIHPAHNGLLQVGDAKLTVEPLAGTGMAHAMETGILAAKAIHTGFQLGRSYEDIVSDFKASYRAKYSVRLKLLQYLRPLLFSTDIQNGAWPVLKASTPLLASAIR